MTYTHRAIPDQNPRRDPIPIENAPFSQLAHDHRNAKTRAAMAQAGLEGLFVTDPSNQASLTGYDGWSLYVHQGVIRALDGDPVWWGHLHDTRGGQRIVWMHDDNVLGYADHHVQSIIRHLMQGLAAQLRDKGHHTAHIGFEMENDHDGAKAHAILTTELPNATLADTTTLVNWQRAVKSPEEVTFIRKTARISGKIAQLAIERTEPGLKKNQLVGDITQAAEYGVHKD